LASNLVIVIENSLKGRLVSWEQARDGVSVLSDKKSFGTSNALNQRLFVLRKIAKWRHSFLKTEYSAANSLFLNKKQIRQKATENWFCGGWCRHIYAYWLQFSEFLEINSPVKSKSA
jgi:hypothetical protein